MIGIHSTLIPDSPSKELTQFKIPQEGRNSLPDFPSKELTHFQIPPAKNPTSSRPRHPKKLTHPIPDTFLPIECQREVDSIHCHPVDLLLPPSVVPPNHRVAHSTNVLVISESIINRKRGKGTKGKKIQSVAHNNSLLTTW